MHFPCKRLKGEKAHLKIQEFAVSLDELDVLGMGLTKKKKKVILVLSYTVLNISFKFLNSFRALKKITIDLNNKCFCFV